MTSRLAVIAAVVLIAAVATVPTPAVAQQTVAKLPNFDSDIRPILAARCIKCHGNGKAEAGLRLSDRSNATSKLESGHIAIVPGKPDESELIRRLTSADDAERMPPEGPRLKPEEVAAIKGWIESGADWPLHWAYRPLASVPVPRAQTDAQANWQRSDIDAFILQKLAERHLSPAPPADKRTLLRRVYFDLVGLPPTMPELDAFLNDAAPDAYERVVDRLLASPQYGERWARHWMDLVHYAETHGHDQDRPRENAWPYRDYLIRSFNDDKPFARFVQEQIAGDAMFPGDSQAIVATGFLATGPWDESSLRDIRDDTIDREIARYIDRDDIVTTVMATFASSTVHCARCHDHKFDPISQRDYYALQAIFSATDKANRQYEPDPDVAARRQQLTAALAALPEREKSKDAALLEPGLQSEVTAWEAEVAQAAGKWQNVEVLERTSGAGGTLKSLEDGSLLAGGARPDKEVYTIVAKSAQTRVTGLRLEVLTHDTLPMKGPGRADNGNLHLNELRVWAHVPGHGSQLKEVKLQDPQADFNQDGGWSIEKAIDGNPNTAWGIHPDVANPHVAVFTLADPLIGAEPIILKVELQQIHGGGHLIGRFRLSTTDAFGKLSTDHEALPPRLTELLHKPRKERTDDEQMGLTVTFLRKRMSAELAELPPTQLVYCGSNQFVADGSFKPASGPRPVRLLNRGDISQPGDEAVPASLNCIPDMPGTLTMKDPTNEGDRRAALAQWMTDSRNVLSWRSMANRLWQHHFGRALVDTPNDFGTMGDVPTHPELLDWLALELQRSGGSFKQLHRQIVTSSVYRQSSQHNPQFAEIDADNKFLWRMNRTRLDAESVRDAVLQVAGTIDPKMGGPSVRQFIQSPGVHVTPVVDYTNFNVDDPANCRRSVYRFVFRTLPDPFMDALDCPDASQLTPVRGASVTALQALATLNDKLIIRQCEHLAERLASSESRREDQVARAFREILGRAPDEKESQAVNAYAAKHGLANTCRFLLNSNEFMFVD